MSMWSLCRSLSIFLLDFSAFWHSLPFGQSVHFLDLLGYHLKHVYSQAAYHLENLLQASFKQRNVFGFNVLILLGYIHDLLGVGSVFAADLDRVLECCTELASCSSWGSARERERGRERERRK